MLKYSDFKYDLCCLGIRGVTPMVVLLKGRDQLVIRELETVIGRVIKLDKSLKKSFINIRLDDTEQISVVFVKAF